MKSIFKLVVLAAVGLAISYLIAFHHPVITFEYQQRFDAAGKAVVLHTSREAQLRPPKPEESRVRLAACLLAESLLLLIASYWIHLHRRSKVVPEGGTLTIEGEPIHGELVMPMPALEDRRTPTSIGMLLAKSREVEV